MAKAPASGDELPSAFSRPFFSWVGAYTEEDSEVDWEDKGDERGEDGCEEMCKGCEDWDREYIAGKKGKEHHETE